MTRSDAGVVSRGSDEPRPALDAPPGLEAYDVDDALVLLTWTARPEPPPAGLSQAEAAVLQLVREGLSNAEIAARRGRSPRTIANQVARIFRRLGVGSRAEIFARFAGR
jgi:DNA-binding CsgD family transcriptional regulator